MPSHRNGQLSDKTFYQKSNNSISHQPLNLLNHDLYASRLTAPPKVQTDNIKKLTKDPQTKKKITKSSEKAPIKKPNNQKTNQKNQADPMDITEESLAGPSTLLTQPYAPIMANKEIVFPNNENIIHSINDNGNIVENTKNNKTKAKKIVSSLSERINYNITEDVLSRKADIDIKDLLIAAPSLKRDLVKSIRIKTSKPKPKPEQLTLAFAEDDDVDTTAIYTDVYIGTNKIKAILDTGSAKTVMSRKLAETLGLKIDTPSTSVFTLGNGSRQAALGLIYDVQINLGGKLIIPGSIEVLPVCPTQLIIGNNWLKRAKAKINLEEKVVKIEYKGMRAQVPFIFTKPNETFSTLKVHPTTYIYNNQDINTTNVPNPINVISDDSDEDNEDPSESESDTDDLLPESSDDESEGDLFMLEDTYGEFEENNQLDIMKIENDFLYDDNFIIKVNKPFYISPYTQTQFTIKPNNFDPKTLNQSKFIFQVKSTKLHDLNSVWQPSSSYLQQCGDTFVIHLVNHSDKIMKFYPPEIIGEIEMIQLVDIDQMDCYNVRKSDNTDIEFMYQAHHIDHHDDDDLTKYEEKISNKIDIKNIPPSIKTEYMQLMKRYDHIFDWNNDKIGNIDIMEHTIKLKKDAKPKRVRPYRLSPLETKSLKAELDKLLKLGIIEKGGYSEWSSPIIMLKKKDGTYRIVADFRYLNTQSEVMNYPLNNIDELLDTLNKAYWMSTFDLRSGFFQANISKESQPLTTVVCSLGDFYFKKLPMGIKTSPSVFSQMMEQCFHELINNCIIIYLDDVTCYTDVKGPEQHLQDLAKTFTCMDKHGIVLNPAKCHFFKDKILFLGYVVTRDTIEPNPDTIDKVKNFPIPTNIKQVRSFLGLASYYRRFVPQFAKIARPLHAQLQTTKKVAWTDETTKAFNLLKEHLTSEPVLCKPDFNKEFYVVTDASKDGLGAVLTQKDDEGHEHPIVYSSRSVHGAEANYGISKLELLAVVWAVQLYRPYLLGSQFTVTVISDHSALNGLLKTKQPTGILARWIEILAEYDFQIRYRPGRVNESADYLSRLGY